MIYPGNKYKDNWDIWMAIVLIVSCMIAPVRIAFFPNDESLGWTVYSFTIDGFFFLDIFVVFTTAF